MRKYISVFVAAAILWTSAVAAAALPEEDKKSPAEEEVLIISAKNTSYPFKAGFGELQPSLPELP